MVWAISWGLGQASWSALGIAARLAGVSISEGSTALTRMRSAASSGARVWVSAATPALAAAYAAIWGAGTRTGRAATLTSRPPWPVLRIERTASRHDRKQVTALIRHCFSNSANDVSVIAAIENPPASWIDAHSGGNP